MALPSRIASQLRSSAPLVRNSLIRRGFSSQNGSSKGASMFGNAAPFLLGVASGVTSLMAGKYVYENRHQLHILPRVHAASRFVV